MGWGFEKEKLDEGKIAKLKEMGRLARGDILKMTTLAKSGHPGGSMSSIEKGTVLFSKKEKYSFFLLSFQEHS